MRNEYIRTLHELARDNREIMALVADNGIIVYDEFRRECARQFLNFGIAESTMVGAAAGLAACGKIPFVYTIIPFLSMRAFEQIRNDICLQKKNVKLVGIGAGFSYSTLGPTHHGTEDIGLMRILPNLSIISPATPLEARAATLAAAASPDPVYIRLGTFKGKDFYTDGYCFEFGKAMLLRSGEDVTLISTGNIITEVLAASDRLEGKGIRVNVLNIHTIKPLDSEAILEAAGKTKVVITIEEHSIYGGLGSAVSEVLSENGKNEIVFKRIGLQGTFASGYGSYETMRVKNSLDKDSIAREVEQIVARNNFKE